MSVILRTIPTGALSWRASTDALFTSTATGSMCRVALHLLNIALRAIGAGAMARLARAVRFHRPALAGLRASSLALPALQVRESPRLRMHLPNLLVALDVEISHFLPRRRPHRLLVVRAQTPPSRSGAVTDPVRAVDAARLVGGLVFLVEGGEGSREARGEAVLVVEGDGLLDCAVRDDVAVREVLGDDAGAGLVLLGDLAGLVGGLVRGFDAGDVVEGAG